MTDDAHYTDLAVPSLVGIIVVSCVTITAIAFVAILVESPAIPMGLVAAFAGTIIGPLLVLAKLKEMDSRVSTLVKQTDGLKDQLVAEVRAAAKAQGKKEEKQDQAARASAIQITGDAPCQSK